MNQTFRMKLSGEHRNIKGWRLFQIVFIVSLICEIIRSEYRDDRTIAEADIEAANLLYFPTGGGKTEAFLGACIFAMFFDRIRGKNDGITAFLKYPLRLLAVQQLERVLTVVMKANAVREQTAELGASTPFQVGFYVGKDNTPNKIDAKESLSDRGEKGKSRDLILESDEDTLDEYYRFIDTCPNCGEKTIHIRFNKENWRLEHVCDNGECSITALPLMIVDSEIYRYLPSIVVSTIDKMSMLGTTNDFRMMFGQVRSKCPVHSFSSGKKCSCPGCSYKIQPLPVGYLKDPVPTLFIQDEMHLVKESLGTFDSHYESFISYYAKELIPKNQQKQIRFIGATATISSYESHVRNLYHGTTPRRFPCSYPSVKTGEDFYSYLNNLDTDQRKDLRGYFGGGADTRFWRAYQKAVANARPDFKPEGLDEYWLNETKIYNDETKAMLEDIETKVKVIIAERLEEYYGEGWLIKGLPKNIYTRAKSEADEAMYEQVVNDGEESEMPIWDFVTLSDCKAIVLNGKNWSLFFEDVFVRPEERNLPGGKETKTDWMLRLHTLQNKTAKESYSVPVDEYSYVKSVHDWLMGLLII